MPYQQLRIPPRGPTQYTILHDSPEQVIRFKNSQPERQFWLDLLPSIDPNIRRIERFQSCGRYAYVTRDLETGRLFLRGETCKLRICPACRRRIQYRSSQRVLEFMHSNPQKAWQFHTFTLKHSSAPLPDQLQRLVASFRKLRHRKLWRTSVQTGYAVIEVEYHPAGSWSPAGRRRIIDEWHPHLHVVAATDFIDWSSLRSDWRSVTGDSDNIDCSLVESPKHAAHYIAKYIGKPPNLNLRTQPKRAAEYYRALQHRRLLMPFGETVRHKPPPPPPPPPTQLVCLYADLRESARSGSYTAQCMLANLILAVVPDVQRRPDQHHNLFDARPT